ICTLSLHDALPIYNAVMLCVLTPERTALKLAMPLTTGAVPITVAPSRKVTLPVGAPGLAGPGATVAVIVTLVLAWVAGADTLVMLVKPMVIAPNRPSCWLLIPAEK